MIIPFSTDILPELFHEEHNLSETIYTYNGM